MYIESAHKIKDYKGLCRNLHGHSYQVFLLKKVKRLDSTNIAIDFHILKNDEGILVCLEKIKKVLDHCYLKEDLLCDNMTAEKLAKDIYDMINGKYVVVVKETHDSICIYDGKYWFIGADNL